jgi:hypothetical protein
VEAIRPSIGEGRSRIRKAPIAKHPSGDADAQPQDVLAKLEIGSRKVDEAGSVR